MNRTGLSAALGITVIAIAATAATGAAHIESPWKIAFTSNRQGDSEIYAMNANGTGVRRLTHSPKFDGAGPWSPDGNKMLFYSQRAGGETWVMNADGSGQRRLTPVSSWNAPGGWSPDGRKILFTSNRDGNNELYVMNADGSGQRILSAAPSSDETAADWSPDGKTIAFVTNRDGNSELYVENADGSNPRNLTKSPGNDGGLGGIKGALFSPDGSKLLFASTRDTHDQDNSELYVANVDGTGIHRLTHRPGVEAPLSWSPDGRNIAFQIAYPATKPRWAFFVMNADGTGAHKVTWNLPGR